MRRLRTPRGFFETVVETWLGVCIALLGLLLLSGTSHAQVCVVAPPGLVSWWPGDGNANDITGTNDGSLMNGATFAAGFVTSGNGLAFSFDGVDDFVEIADAANLDGFNELTVDAWVFPEDSLPFNLGIFKWNLGNVEDDASYQLSFLNGKLYLLIKVDGKTFFQVFNQGPDIPLNTWSHVAMVWEGQSGTVKGYLNGTLVVSSANSRLVGIIDDSPHPVKIGGGLSNVPNTFFDGLIDEVEIYDRALTATEIAAIFDARSAGKCKLVAGLDHFLCYKAKSAEGERKFERRDVDLDDQFGATTKTVKKPKFLCTPVAKDGERVIDPAGHLVCYEVKGQDEFEKRDVLVFNQFEDVEEGRILTIKKPNIVCVPSTKEDLGVVVEDDDDDSDSDSDTDSDD